MMAMVRLRFVREEAVDHVVQVAICGTAPMVFRQIYEVPEDLAPDLLATGDWSEVKKAARPKASSSAPAEESDG